MRIAVCDDELSCRRQLTEALEGITKSLDVTTSSFEDGRGLLRVFEQTPFDLVFLDIEMPVMDGITLAKKLRAVSEDVAIVFLTSHIEYALEGYEVNALRYLTKPVQSSRLREVIDHVTAKLLGRRSLWIKTEDEEIRLPISHIICFEARNQNILIRTEDREYTVRYNIADYENELSSDGFFRTHRSYLVSLNKITSIGKGEVTLVSGVRVPVSRSREKELCDALFSCVKEGAI